MAKLFTPPPSMRVLISYLVEWLAKNMNARVTINVYYNDKNSFTEVADERIE